MGRPVTQSVPSVTPDEVFGRDRSLLARGFLSRPRESASADTTARARDDKFARSVEYQHCDFDVLDTVSKVATERGVTNSQVALAWVLQAPRVDAPIIGSTKLAHLDEAVAALDLKLTREEVAALEKPYRSHSILGHEPPKPSRMSR